MDGRKNKRRGRGYNSPNRGRGRGNGDGNGNSPGTEEPLTPTTTPSSSQLSSSLTATTPSRPKEDPVKDSSAPVSTPSSTASQPSAPLRSGGEEVKAGSAQQRPVVESATTRKISATPPRPSEDPSSANIPLVTPKTSKEQVLSTPKSGGSAPKAQEPKPEGASKSSGAPPPKVEAREESSGGASNYPEGTAQQGEPKSDPPKPVGKGALESRTKLATTTTPAPPKEEPVVVKSAVAPTATKPQESTKSAPQSLPSPSSPTTNPGVKTRDMSSSTPVSKVADESDFQTPTAHQEETFSTPTSSLSPERDQVGTTPEATPAKSLPSTPPAKTPSTPAPPPSTTTSSKSEPLRERPPTPPKPSRKQEPDNTPSVTTPPTTSQAPPPSGKQGTLPTKRSSLTESGKFSERSVQDASSEEVANLARKGSIGGKLGYMGSFGAGSNISTVGNVHGLTDQEDALTNRSTASQATSLLGFTKRQVATLLVFSFANFFSAVIISLQAPFYPQEAEAKGATATEYGLVMGVFELVVFITSPIYGKYLQKVGPKTVFNIGIFTTGVMTIAFGFLDRFNDRTVFVSLSFAVRIIEAMGDAAFITASFAIIATEFPESVATTFASLETFFGLGLIVGPTLGGALYQTGGFTLPFAVMGGLLLLVGFFAFFVMPKPKAIIDDGKKVPGTVFSILKVPGVALASFSIVAASISVGFLNSTLEPHIRQFVLTPVMTGLIFVINGGLYAVTAPAWGWVCDRFTQPRHVGLLGAISVLLGFLLIGPAPFVPLDTVLWLTCLGLVIHGIGLGAMLVSSFILALRESISHGFADNIHTYGLTSALWTSSFAFGAFVGPSVGGILLDQVGFRWATVFVIGVQLLLTILLVAFIARTRAAAKGFKEGNMEAAPLLKSASEDPCSSKTALEKNGNGGSYQKPASGYGAV